MSLAGADVSAITITLQLAAITTLLLMLIATPLAWWLTHTHARWRAAATALVSLPLVLPPTVLGFYLLVLLGPQGTVGRMMQHFGLATLPFTFGGLVVGSVVFSLPFAVQPIANAFAAIGARPLEAAATLRASPWDRFWSVAVPLARPGFMTAAVLAFAHTVGEFGVVLMLGGNIPGETRVLSVAIYDHVEALEYGDAHLLSAGLVGFSFVVLLMLGRYGGHWQKVPS
ncbi:MAG TPA: molybdate ABC transporter permease subunit [Steroidobacteraceae bacterium]|nr:molybdate ABC transporter permease subunit [Steroidobacteraceae bacterium]